MTPEERAPTLAEAMKAEEDAMRCRFVHHTRIRGPMNLNEAVRLSQRMEGKKPMTPARIATTDGKNEFERSFPAEMGGSIRTHASEIDFDASYTFQSWEGGRLYEWLNIRAIRDGDAAVFILPPTEAK